MGMDRQSALAVDVVPAWDRPLFSIPAFTVLSLIGGFFPSFSLAANLYVLVLGGVLMCFGLSGRMHKRASPWRVTRSATWWLLPAVAFVGIELTDFLLGSTNAHPTLSVLADPALAHYSIRVIAYCAWLGGFWGLVRR